jgi:hypothetical protein
MGPRILPCGARATRGRAGEEAIAYGLGGRIAIAADAKIGSALVRLHVLHLESTLSALEIRDAQAEEIAADGEGVTHPVIAEVSGVLDE